MADNAVTISIGAQDNASAAFRKVAEALGQMGKQAGAAGQQTQKAVGEINAASKALGALKGAVAGYLSLQMVRNLIAQADAWTNLNNKLRLVTASSEELRQVQSRLVAMAMSTRSDLGATVTLYARAARATQQLGISQEKLLTITRTVNEAFQISGATSSEAGAAAIQLSQALASGTLRGEELNSIMEQAPRITQALVSSLSIQQGEIRKLAMEGKLTSEIVAAALAEQSAKVHEEFGKMEVTVGSALTNISTAWTVFIGRLNEGTELSKDLSAAILKIADAIVGAAGKMDDWYNAAKRFFDKYGDELKFATTFAFVGAGPAIAGALPEGVTSYDWWTDPDKFRAMEDAKRKTRQLKTPATYPGFDEMTMGAQGWLASVPNAIPGIGIKGVAVDAFKPKPQKTAKELLAEQIQKKSDEVATKEAERERKRKAEEAKRAEQDRREQAIRTAVKIDMGRGSDAAKRAEKQLKDALVLMDKVMLEEPQAVAAIEGRFARIGNTIRKVFVAPGGVFHGMQAGWEQFRASLGEGWQQIASATSAGLQTFQTGLSQAFGSFLFGDEAEDNVKGATKQLREIQGIIGSIDLGVLTGGGSRAEASMQQIDALFGLSLSEPLPEEVQRRIQGLRAQVMGLFAQPSTQRQGDVADAIGNAVGDLGRRDDILNRFKRFGEDISDALKRGMETTIVESLTGAAMRGLMGLTESFVGGLLGREAKKSGEAAGQAVGGGLATEFGTKLTEIGQIVAAPFVVTAKFLWEGFTGPVWDVVVGGSAALVKTVSAVWEGGARFAGPVWDAVVSGSASLVKTVSALFAQGAGWVGGIWNFITGPNEITKTISAALEITSDAISGVTDLFKSAGSIGQKIKTGLGSTIVEAFAMSQVASGIGGLFGKNAAIGAEIYSSLGALLGSIIPGVGTMVGGLLGGVSGVVLSMLQSGPDEQDQAYGRTELLTAVRKAGSISAMQQGEGGVYGYLEREGFGEARAGLFSEYDYLKQDFVRMMMAERAISRAQAEAVFRTMRAQAPVQTGAGEVLLGGGGPPGALYDPFASGLPPGYTQVQWDALLAANTGSTLTPTSIPAPAPAATSRNIDLYALRTAGNPYFGGGSWASQFRTVSGWMDNAAATQAVLAQAAVFNAGQAVGSRLQIDQAMAARLWQGGQYEVPLYARGGWVPGPIGQPQVAVVHGGEYVQPVGGAAGPGVSIVINVSANGDRALVDLLRREVLPELEERVERGFRRRVRFGQTDIDNRGIRTVLQ